MKNQIKITQAIWILINAAKKTEKLDSVFCYLWEEYADNDAEELVCEDLINYALRRYKCLERIENQ